jgi:hypothetical protein
MLAFPIVHAQDYSYANVASTVVLNTFTPGVHWTDKLVTASGSPQCASGCIIEIPDSVADDGSATTPSIPSKATLRFTGSGIFKACVISMGTMSKAVDVGSAIVQLNGANCTGFTYSTQATLQTNDRPRLEHILVDCNNQINSTGVLFGGASTKLLTVGLQASHCTNSGLELLGGQFTDHYASSFWADTVGVKIYTVLGSGGGNSNSFHGMVVTNGKVGVLLNDNGGSALGMTANVFENCNMVNNSVASYASKQLYPVSSFTVLGGTTETTGSTPSIVIDGFTINNASIYIFGPGSADLDHFYNADATVTPWAVLRNTARLNIINSGGYGKGSGVWADTDSSSTVAFIGPFINVPNAVQMTGTGTLINK